jgi:hypothetical protein
MTTQELIDAAIGYLQHLPPLTVDFRADLIRDVVEILRQEKARADAAEQGREKLQREFYGAGMMAGCDHPLKEEWIDAAYAEFVSVQIATADPAPDARQQTENDD